MTDSEMHETKDDPNEGPYDWLVKALEDAPNLRKFANSLFRDEPTEKGDDQGSATEDGVQPMTDDLVTFLRARLDEDEAIARAALPGPWRHSSEKHWRKPGTTWFEEAVFAGEAGASAICVAGTGETDDPQSMADATHIARHDPARVLRDVEAKRRIVELVIGAYAGYATLPLLALPYSEHPDYREEWQA